VLVDEVRDSFTEQVGEKVLENPTITKLMHGCLSSDLPWLQRDFGIKVSNIFDTQEFERSFVKGKDL